jgi:D-alanyl-D-alanine carboxypeptidase/D-alanyl-D-alanine-endopeptidase (penicillin-binding protein 4)
MTTTMLGLLLSIGCPTAQTLPTDAEHPEEGTEASLLEDSTLLGEMARILEKPYLKGAEVGGLIWNLETGKDLWAHHANLPINPASVQKVITTLTVLEHLGPKTILKTQVRHDGAFENGVINGNLYLVGAGDPSMVIERLWKLAVDVRAEGVEQVTGDLVVDASILGDGHTIPGWPGGTDSEKSPAYEAPISGFPLNYNSVAIVIRPGGKIGTPATASTKVPSSYFVFENTASTGKPGSKKNLVVHRTDSRTIRVTGSIAADAQSQHYYFNVDRPTEYVANSFADLFQSLGGNIQGRSRPGKLANKSKLLVTQSSDPVGVQLGRMNAYSNNQIAEHLLRLAAIQSLGDASPEGGVRVVQQTLKSHGISLDGAVFFNGSGLTRQGRVTARQVADVYTTLFHHPNWQWEGLASLSIYGLPGGIRARNSDSEFLGQVRLKAGTIQGVLTLSGLLRCNDEQTTLGFVLLMQNLNQAWAARDSWEDTMQATWNQCPELTQGSKK